MENRSTQIIAISSAILATIAAIFTVKYFAELIVPFLIALLLWYIIVIVTRFFQNLPPGKKQLPYWLSLTLSVLVCCGVLLVAVELFIEGFLRLTTAFPDFGTQIAAALSQLFDRLGILETEFNGLSLGFATLINSVIVGLGAILSAAGSVASFVSTVFLYMVFLLFQYHFFYKKIDIIFPHSRAHKKARAIITDLDFNLQKSLKIMVLISFIAAAITWLILFLLGIKFAFFIALIGFIVGFIPIIGTILATVLPMLFILVHFGSWTAFLLSLLILGGMQFYVGSILCPRLLGKAIYISPLVTVISIIVGGVLLGPTGLFLGAFITGTIMIVCAHFPPVHWIATMLSAEGNIELKK